MFFFEKFPDKPNDYAVQTEQTNQVRNCHQTVERVRNAPYQRQTADSADERQQNKDCAIAFGQFFRIALALEQVLN